MRLLDFQSWQIPMGAAATTALQAFRDILTGAGYRILQDGTVMTYNTVLGNMGDVTTQAKAFNDQGVFSPVHINGYTDPGYYAGLSFDAPQAVGSFMLLVDDPTSAPTNFTLQWSDDNVAPGVTPTNWTDQESFARTQAQWRINFPVLFPLTTTAAAHKHWRLKFTGWVSNYYRYIAELRFYNTSGNPSRYFNKVFIDIVPPATEPVGNVNAFSFVRLMCDGGSLNYRLLTKSLVNLPQQFVIRPTTAGATNYSVTINGATVTQSPAAVSTNTALTNLQQLFLTLKASTDPTISLYAYEYVAAAALNADETDVIRATRKAYNAVLDTITVTGGTYVFNGESVPAGSTNEWLDHYDDYYGNAGQNSSAGSGMREAIDLINGYVYMVSVYNRGFSIALKLNASYQGAITWEWADNAKANAALPTPINPWLYPVELFAVCVGAGGNTTSTGWDTNLVRTSHHLTIANNHGAITLGAGNNGDRMHPFQRNKQRGMVFASDWRYQDGYISFLSSSGIWGNNSLDTVGNDFQVHRMTMASNFVYDQNVIIPAVPLECIFHVVGAINNEQTLLIADTTVAGLLTTDLDNTTDFATLTLTDTSKLAPAGIVVVTAGGMSENIAYTGNNVATNTLTGCTRKMYASKRQFHWTGDAVRQGLWFIKINDSALFCGYTKPQ